MNNQVVYFSLVQGSNPENNNDKKQKQVVFQENLYLKKIDYPVKKDCSDLEKKDGLKKRKKNINSHVDYPKDYTSINFFLI